MSKERMRCPDDGSRLVEVERADVLIDACPTCRGVWLDRGELDKILVEERQLSAGDPDEDFSSEDDRHSKKRERKSFLEDLLDF